MSMHVSKHGFGADASKCHTCRLHNEQCHAALLTGPQISCTAGTAGTSCTPVLQLHASQPDRQAAQHQHKVKRPSFSRVFLLAHLPSRQPWWS